MTIIDRLGAGTRAMVQPLIDKEAANYIETATLYGAVITGRYHVSMLSVFYNHAQDPQLKELIKVAIDNLSEGVVKKCENLLRAADAKTPMLDYPEYPLEKGLDIPAAAHLTDSLIAMSLVNMDGASQMALLTAIHQCYQPEITRALRIQLDKALDWGYRLLQLMLDRGWLPEVAKVNH